MIFSAQAARTAESIRSAWRAYWERRARRASVLVLQSLDAHMLHDMGINRSEIESVVYGPPLERRRTYGPSCD